MLRSSSTPILGSLLSSVPESPNNNHHHHLNHVVTNPHTKPPCHTKLSIHQHASPSPVSCTSSPISPALVEPHKGFRRVQSEGNLDACFNDKKQDCSYENSSNPSKAHLQTIPSFAFYSSRGEREEDDIDEMMSDIEDSNYEYDDDDDRSEKGSVIMNTGLTHDNTIGGNKAWNLGYGVEKELAPQQMYLAKGLGIGSYSVEAGGNNGGRKGFNPADLGGGGGGGGGDNNKQDIEKHYKKMVEENPGNPLCLRNYAQFLYQTKRDLQGAEAYYSRAILSDPTDGDILSQYAQLVWELNHDHDRALSYFERAVHASPENSHVQAAYANFLWETEEDDDDDDCDLLQNFDAPPPYLHNGGIASVIG